MQQCACMRARVQVWLFFYSTPVWNGVLAMLPDVCACICVCSCVCVLTMCTAADKDCPELPLVIGVCLRVCVCAMGQTTPPFTEIKGEEMTLWARHLWLHQHCRLFFSPFCLSSAPWLPSLQSHSHLQYTHYWSLECSNPIFEEIYRTCTWTRCSRVTFAANLAQWQTVALHLCWYPPYPWSTPTLSTNVIPHTSYIQK